MDKKDLSNIITEIFIPIGFKKKGNNWVLNGNELTKMVNLQKSQYSDSFYINYGYILKSVPLGQSRMHLFYGIGSIDHTENEKIKKLLNLENDISDQYRKTELIRLIHKEIVHQMQLMNTEEDILRELKTRPHLNDVPLTVKKYFNLD